MSKKVHHPRWFSCKWRGRFEGDPEGLNPLSSIMYGVSYYCKAPVPVCVKPFYGHDYKSDGEERMTHPEWCTRCPIYEFAEHEDMKEHSWM